MSKIKCLHFTGLVGQQRTWFNQKGKAGTRFAYPDQKIAVTEFEDPQQYVNNGMAVVVEFDDASAVEEETPLATFEETQPPAIPEPDEDERM